MRHNQGGKKMIKYEFNLNKIKTKFKYLNRGV